MPRGIRHRKRADKAKAPVDRQVAEKTTSGLHSAIIAEERRQSNAALVRNWEDFWDGATRMYYRFWKRTTIYPQQLRGIGPRGQAVFRRISSLDITHEVEVGIVRGSMEPQSRIGAFAQWSELLGKGVGNPMNPIRPEIEQRMWNDIGKGDMTATWQDLEAPRDNAEDILVRLIAGESIVPRLQDSPELCFDVIRSYMMTDQYRGRLMVDPHLEIRLSAALDQFGRWIIAKQQAAIMGQIAAAGAGPRPPGESAGPVMAPNAVQAAAQTFAPGAPIGGQDSKGTQGMSTVPNPNRDQGGNPG